MARAALRWHVRELAARAEVSANTVTRIEGDHPANRATLAALARTFEQAGIEFLFGEAPGVRLHGGGSPRETAALENEES